MNADYLWDGTGPVDADVASLEVLLGGLRVGPPASERWMADVIVRPARAARRSSRWWLAMAAMVALTGLSARLAHRAPEGEWAIAPLEGSPRVGGRALSGSSSVRVGEWVETDAGARAAIADPAVGTVLIGPGSRVRLTGAGAKHVVEMSRGRIEATIHAPAGVFYVDTPSARAIDLGCAYTLEVDARGGGLLRVTLGYVELAWHGRRSWVPRGATCRIMPGEGPGTPYFADAGSEFAEALRALDAGDGRALDSVLELARARDGLTLWHLLSRTSERERTRVVARLADLHPPPEGLSMDKVMALDAAELDRWLQWMRPF